MATLLWVAAGGALGAAARYLVSLAFHGEGGFPWATLLVNAAGSLCIGFAWGAWAQLPWFQMGQGVPGSGAAGRLHHLLRLFLGSLDLGAFR